MLVYLYFGKLFRPLNILQMSKCTLIVGSSQHIPQHLQGDSSLSTASQTVIPQPLGILSGQASTQKDMLERHRLWWGKNLI